MGVPALVGEGRAARSRPPLRTRRSWVGGSSAEGALKSSAWAPITRAVPVPGYQPFVALAFAEELTADPTLLEAFARTVALEDGVQLVVYAPDVDPAELERRLGPLVEAAGLAGDDAPEILALAVPRDAQLEAALAEGADCLYARAAHGEAFGALPRVSDFRPDLLPYLARQARRGGLPDGDSFLLLTYDSCRYDVLLDAHTPVLDSYAQIVRAQTPANFTFAAHQAFFVGILPNALDPVPYANRFTRQLLRLGEVGEAPVLKPARTTVASDENLVAGLRTLGYQTVGAGAMNWFRQRSLTDCFERFRFTGTDADGQIDYLLSELDPSRPFFAFLNFGETHDPYDYAGKPDPCPVEIQSRRIEWPPVRNGVPVGRDCPAWWHQREAAEFLDSRLPRLFAALPPETIVILCGDHGEAFGEDGYWGHGVNHPTVLEVPLSIFRLDRRPLT